MTDVVEGVLRCDPYDVTAVLELLDTSEAPVFPPEWDGARVRVIRATGKGTEWIVIERVRE